MPSALITGITGQDGSYLAELLLEKGYDVHGMVRRASTEKFDRIEHVRDRITLHQADLLDERSLVDALRAARPDEVYNLAAMSFVAVSWVQPTLTAEFTGVGVTRMLEAMREACPGARFYQASSSEMFGKVRETPQTEATPFYPRSPYGVAKVYGHPSPSTTASPTGCSPPRGSCSTMRASGAAGVRHPQGHVARRRHQARAARQGRAGQSRRPPRLGLRQGLRRGDVADAPAGRRRRLRDRHGRVDSVRRLVEIAFDEAGLDWRPRVVIDDSLKRPAEVDHLVGDASKARRELGWAPRTSFEELIRRMARSDLELLSRRAGAAGASWSRDTRGSRAPGSRCGSTGGARG